MKKSKIIILLFPLFLSFCQLYCCTMIALQLSSKKSLTAKSTPEEWANLKSGKELHVFLTHDNLLTGKFVQFKNDTSNSLAFITDQDSQNMITSSGLKSSSVYSGKIIHKDIFRSPSDSVISGGIVIIPELQRGVFVGQNKKLYIPLRTITKINYPALKWGWIALGITADAACVYSAISLLDMIPGIDWKLRSPRKWIDFYWRW